MLKDMAICSVAGVIMWSLMACALFWDTSDPVVHVDPSGVVLYIVTPDGVRHSANFLGDLRTYTGHYDTVHVAPLAP
jgi:hypothetical protein